MKLLYLIMRMINLAFKKIDMINRRFGKLVVLEEVGKEYNGYIYKCKCDCGNEKIILGSSLRNGNTRSCGCIRRLMHMKNNLN